MEILESPRRSETQLSEPDPQTELSAPNKHENEFLSLKKKKKKFVSSDITYFKKIDEFKDHILKTVKHNGKHKLWTWTRLKRGIHFFPR